MAHAETRIETLGSRLTRTLRRRAVVAAAVLPLAALIAAGPPNPAAQQHMRLTTTAYPNGSNADVGLSFVGQNGANAATADRNAGITVHWNPDGECIDFAWSVVSLASHGQVHLTNTLGHVYYDAYANAGASLVSLNNAAKGDVIQIYNPANHSGYVPGMHTAIIVQNLGGGSFDVVDSNFVGYHLVGHHPFNPFGQAAPHGLSVAFWHFGVAPVTAGIAMRNDGSGFRVDGSGVITAFGGAPTATATATWPGQDIVRGIVLRPDGLSGYTLDLFGGLHPFAAAGTAMPAAPAASVYWPNWDIARGVVALTGQDAGYVLDGYGGLHPFAGAGTAMPATPAIAAYWAGWDIARAVAVFPNQAAGYVLDGYGGLHPFAAPGTPLPAYPTGVAYWAYWDIARGVVIVAGGTQPSGYTLDGYGGVHAFGDAGPPGATIYWPGNDIARGIAVTPGSTVNRVRGDYVSAAGALGTISYTTGCPTCQ